MFTLVKQTLNKELVEALDRIALDVYFAEQLNTFPYKSFGETLNLVMTSMLRELLHNTKGNIILVLAPLQLGRGGL